MAELGKKGKERRRKEKKKYLGNARHDLSECSLVSCLLSTSSSEDGEALDLGHHLLGSSDGERCNTESNVLENLDEDTSLKNVGR